MPLLKALTLCDLTPTWLLSLIRLLPCPQAQQHSSQVPQITLSSPVSAFFTCLSSILNVLLPMAFKRRSYLSFKLHSSMTSSGKLSLMLQHNSESNSQMLSLPLLVFWNKFFTYVNDCYCIFLTIMIYKCPHNIWYTAFSPPLSTPPSLASLNPFGGSPCTRDKRGPSCPACVYNLLSSLRFLSSSRTHHTYACCSVCLIFPSPFSCFAWHCLSGLLSAWQNPNPVLKHHF